MAIQTIIYGNASLSRKIEIQYNDNSHTIVSGIILPGSIVPYAPLVANTIIYEQIVVGDDYRVRVQNSAPYAYVELVEELSCEVAIDFCLLTAPSTNQASDGSIYVIASGSNITGYRIIERNGGQFQKSSAFHNLPPSSTAPLGAYHVEVARWSKTWWRSLMVISGGR